MFEILVIIACLFINMLLSGAEMAFVTVSKSQLRRIKLTDKRAVLLLKLKDHPERTLSVVQIGITLVGAIAAAVGGAGAEEAMSPKLQSLFNITEESSEALAIFLVVVPITYLSVVVGELFPKTLALRYSTPLALISARYLFLFEKILSPAVTFLEASTRFLYKLLPLSHAKHEGPEQQEIHIDELPMQTKQYVVNIVSASNKVARDAMIPWSQVDYLQSHQSMQEVESKIIESRHTRLPVLKEGEVVGIINTKEFMAIRAEEGWDSIIRTALKFKQFEPLFKILVKMQESRSHLAIIYEQSSIVGILTLEDIVEEVIGDVFDEDDDGYLKKLLASRAHRTPLIKK